jgi:hypothetical protein
MDLKEKINGMGLKTMVAIVALIVVASAATVAYLSAPATATVNVESPFSVIYTGSSVSGASGLGTDTVGLGTVHAGETFTVTADLTNEADVALKTKTTIRCTDAVGLSCANLNNEVVMTWGTSGTANIPCVMVDANTVEFVTNDGASAIPSGTHTNTIAMTTSVAAGSAYSGVLTCVAQALPA